MKEDKMEDLPTLSDEDLRNIHKDLVQLEVKAANLIVDGQRLTNQCREMKRRVIGETESRYLRQVAKEESP